MKIIIANKFYYPRGGDCISVINLENLLKSKGHQVAIFAMDFPQNLSSDTSRYFPSEVSFSTHSINGAIKAVNRIFSSREVIEKFNKLIDEFQPDILHINNIHSYLSPVIAEEAKKRDIKVFWTLHDYKLICPNYTLLNREGLCDKCIENSISVIKYSCMKAGVIASLLGYLESRYWNIDRIDRSVDAYICPSKFMSNMMSRKIKNHKKLFVLNNFTDIYNNTKIYSSPQRLDYYCYVGRISSEKGVLTLLEAASLSTHKLLLIGEGPLKEELQNKYSKFSNIEFIGYQEKSKVKDYIKGARFTIMPSQCYDNNPLGVIESLCLGTPVLGASIGGIPELINEFNGETFIAKNVQSLLDKLEYMFTTNFDRSLISNRAIKLFSPESHYEQLMEIYTDNY